MPGLPSIPVCPGDGFHSRCAENLSQVLVFDRNTGRGWTVPNAMPAVFGLRRITFRRQTLRLPRTLMEHHGARVVDG